MQDLKIKSGTVPILQIMAAGSDSIPIASSDSKSSCIVTGDALICTLLICISIYGTHKRYAIYVTILVYAIMRQSHFLCSIIICVNFCHYVKSS